MLKNVETRIRVRAPVAAQLFCYNHFPLRCCDEYDHWTCCAAAAAVVADAGVVQVVVDVDVDDEEPIVHLLTSNDHVEEDYFEYCSAFSIVVAALEPNKPIEPIADTIATACT